MDAHPSASLNSARWLVGLCLAVALAGLTWSAWDMFGSSRRSMLQGWDDSFYYFWLPSVVIDHDLDFSNQLAQGATMNADIPARFSNSSSVSVLPRYTIISTPIAQTAAMNTLWAAE